MAFKYSNSPNEGAIQRSVQNPTQINYLPEVQTQSEENWPQTIGRNVLSGLAKGVEGLENIASLPYRFLPQSLQPKALQEIEVPFSERVLGKEYTQPRGNIEEIAQNFLAKTPLIAGSSAAFGLPLLANLASGLAGATTRTGLKEAGFPEWAQTLGEIGTEIGAGKALGRLPTIGSKQKGFYNEVKKLPITEESGTKNIDNAIKVTEDLLKTEVSSSVSDKIQNAVNTIGKLIKKTPSGVDAAGNEIIKKSILPRQLFDARKSLYRLQKSLPQQQRFYLDPLINGINESFLDYSVLNPTWFSNLSQGDKFTQLKHMNSVIGDFAEKYLGKLVPTKYPFIKDFIGTAVGNTVGQSDKFIRKLLKNPTAQQYYFETVKDLAKNDPSLAEKSISALYDALKETPKGEPLVQSNKHKKVGNWKIIEPTR